MAAPTKLYTISSLLMAVLFAVSASFQFNDHDWYFWIPLYAAGSAVNLMSCSPAGKLSDRRIRRAAEFALWLGIGLFVKAVAEAFAGDAVAGIWSVDMTARVVREKMGSGLVSVSMMLQLAATAGDEKNQHLDKQSYLYFGTKVIIGLVVICGLAFVFLVLIVGTMIMHSASSTVQDDVVAPWSSLLEKYVDYGIPHASRIPFHFEHSVLRQRQIDRTPVLTGTIVVLGASYGAFFVLFALLLTSAVLKPSREERLEERIGYGMAALVGIGYGLSLVFHIYHKDHMNF